MEKKALVIAILLSLPSFCLADGLEGRVVANYRGFVLLSADSDKREVILIEEKTRLKNLNEIWDINPWTYLKVSYNREIAGVKVADEVEPLSGVELFDPAIEITTNELFSLIKSRKDYLLIDLRPSKDYSAWHIPSALSSPAHGFNIKDLPSQKDRMIILYSENMRDPVINSAARLAVSSGYKQVRVYRGGIERWIRDGYFTMTTMEYIKGEAKKNRFVFIDTRSEEGFISGHIPGANNILPGRLNPDELMNIDGGKPIVFYGEDASDRNVEDLALIASMAGYFFKSEAPVNILEGGFRAWQAEGMPVEKGRSSSSLNRLSRTLPGTIPYEEFKGLWGKKSDNIMLLDVRTRKEAGKPALEFTKNIPLEELPFRISEIPKDREIITFCSRGIRAMIAYQILKDNGYRVKYLKARPQINPDGTLR